MIWSNSKIRYGAVAMTLHWVIAAMILFMAGLGFFMTRLEETDERTFPLFQLHKSIGLTILMLSLLRLGWRLANPIPALPSGMSPWERFAARGVHVLTALALGAQAVFIGRPYLWALAVGGEQGVRDVYELLRSELELAMALSGRTSIGAIDRTLVAEE